MAEANAPRPDVNRRVLNCPHCAQASIQIVAGQAIVPRENPDDIFSEERGYTLMQCELCREVSLQVHEGVFYTANEVPHFAYPATRKLSNEIPESLRREFEEAQSCYNAKAFTASVVMVRRTLEGISKDSGISERSLMQAVKKMKDAGLMDTTLAEWADGLRVLGNQGAHFTGTRVSQEDANDALAFAEALLDQIYVLRRRFEDFKKRRDAKTTIT
jgi:hypothetical protein